MASIASIQVKEYLQELADGGQIHVERIGTVNWYWSFAGVEQRGREARVRRLGEERDRVQGVVDGLVGALRERERLLSEEEKGGEGQNGDGDVEGERVRLEEERRVVRGERDALRREWESCAGGGGRSGEGGIGDTGMDGETLRREIARLKEETRLWTENVWVVEGYLERLAGGDREVIEAVRRECYGEMYGDGEGLDVI